MKEDDVRVERLLGEGGMGSVFLGRRDDLGSVAAIKVLRDAWISPARRARFYAEQRTLAKLEHPNIARLYDADTLPDGTPYFVMEFVDGLPLDQHCAKFECSPEVRLRLTENGLECSVRYPVELENAAIIDQQMLKALRDALEHDSQFKLVSTGAVVLKSSDT